MKVKAFELLGPHTIASGRFMANIFVHFEPTGPLSEPPKDMFAADLPPYVVPGAFIRGSAYLTKQTCCSQLLLLPGNERIRRRRKLA